MTVKITNVKTSAGEIILTVTYDLKGELKTVKLSKEDVYDRLTQYHNITGRKIKDSDVQDVIVQLINEEREGKSRILDKIDFTTLLNAELEPT